MDKKFFVVDASNVGYDTYEKSVDVAKNLVRSYPTKSYYLVHAEAIVEAAPQPIVVKPLV
jgi:hypothetical protein